MATISITGGTGLVGTALSKMLVDKGHRVIVLSRGKKQHTSSGINYASWDVQKQTIDEGAVNKADFIVHLAGAGVADKRWSTARKQEIMDSRTQSSALLVKAMSEMPNPVKAVISASAIGWYGPDNLRKKGAEKFTEDMPADTSFLGETCRMWEESIKPVEQLGKRLVTYRIGIVLSEEGGALAEFIKPVKFGIGAVLGSGRQVISWIHITDLCRLFLFAIENDSVKGVFNAVAPHPVTNRQLTVSLAEKIKGRFFIPVNVPAFVLKAMLGEMSIEVLKSANVSSSKISSEGFTFLYPTIAAALQDLAPD